jgi:hypothetical protein
MDFIIFGLGAAATALRIFIGYGIPVYLRGQYMADDFLMVRYAESMLQGLWLGEFRGATLTKVVGYSAYLAIMSKLGIPYSLGNTVFYCLCVLLFCMALYKLFPNLYVAFFMYVYLLFSPIMLNKDAIQKIYRAGFQSSVTLLLIAAIIGVYGTILRGQHVVRTILWSILASVSLTVFWFTKEDGIWLVPFVVCGLGIAAVVLFTGGNKPSAGYGVWSGGGDGFGRGRNKPSGSAGVFGAGSGRGSNKPSAGAGAGFGGGRAARSKAYVITCCMCFVLPAVSLLAASFAIRFTNNRHYGEFAVTDRNDTYYSKVMSDLYHIDDGQQPLLIWLSRDGLEKAFEVSPALAETKPYIDGMYQGSWAVTTDGEMHGDGIYWALREAVEANGLYEKGGAVVNEYYKKVHEELTAGFEDGRLPKDTKSIYISSGGRGMTKEEILEYFPAKFPEMVKVLLKYSLNVTAASPAEGDPEHVQRMAAIVKSPYVLEDGSNASEFETGVKCAVYDTLVYSKCGIAVTIVAAIGFLLFFIMLIVGLFRKNFDRVPLMLVSMGMGLSAVLYIFAILWFCAWNTMELAYEYLGPVVLIINALQVLGVSLLVTEIMRVAGRVKEQ